MEEITQIVENIMAKLRDRNVKNGNFNIEQASADKTGGTKDKCTQTSNECYILISVSQSEDGYSYTTWKVLLDTENVFQMERQTSQREISTQTNESSALNENYITIDDDYAMGDVFDDTSEWTEFIDDEIQNKPKFVVNSKREKKKRRNVRNPNWRRRDLSGDPNNNSFTTYMSNDNQFLDRNRDREIYGFHDSETLLLSMDDFGKNLASMPFQTLDTDIGSGNISKYLNCSCVSDNDYSVEDIESNIFASDLNEMDLNENVKSEDLNTQNMYEEVINVSEESLSDELTKEVTGPDLNKTEQTTEKRIKKITLEEYRRRLAEKANATEM